MNKNSFSLEVCVNGRPVKEVSSNQDSYKGFTFIEARKGTQYTLKLKNNTWQRVCAIISVDGLDVITGKNAESTDTGYLINGQSSIEIKGYRVSDENVAAFVFTDGKKSYATANNKALNNGVIGVRFISEKVKEIPYLWTQYMNHSNAQDFSQNPLPKDVTYTMSCNHMSSSNTLKSSIGGQSHRSTPTPKKMDLGTGWGEQINDKVTNVDFEMGDLASEIQIHYASRPVLESLGVDFSPKKQITLPQAFNGNYCKPPVGWKS